MLLSIQINNCTDDLFDANISYMYSVCYLLLHSAPITALLQDEVHTAFF
jgi:hypothetical protein